MYPVILFSLDVEKRGALLIELFLSELQVLVTDFFGSVHMIEMTNSSIVDPVQEENVCRYIWPSTSNRSRLLGHFIDR